MQRQGARVSLILALVFPAIVCAAVALAYYRYRYAEKASSRTETALMEDNEQLAEGVTSRVEERIDRVDAELFEEIEWNDPAGEPPASVDLPAGVESVAVMDEALHIRSVIPAPDGARRRRELDRWGSYVRG